MRKGKHFHTITIQAKNGTFTFEGKKIQANLWQTQGKQWVHVQPNGEAVTYFKEPTHLYYETIIL